MIKNLLFPLLAASALAQPLLAHHGDDFLVLEDAALPKLWHGYLSSSFDWENYSGADSFGAEPTVLFSIAPRLALSVAGSFNDEGDGWDYSSITPRLHVQITPPDSDFPIKVAFSVGYQFAGNSDATAGHSHGAESSSTSSKKKSSQNKGSKNYTATSTSANNSSTHDHDDHDHGGGDTPACDPLVDIDCAQAAQAKAAKAGKKSAKHNSSQNESSSDHNHAATSSSQSSKKKDDCGCGGGSEPSHEAEEEDHEEGGHSHGGIHNHDANQWVGRLIVEADLGATKLLLNLIGNWPEGDSANLGYAVGVRHAFTHMYAAGVEAIGDFEDEGEHEIVLGGYFSPNHSVTMKLGVGFGLTEASPDVTVRTGVVWRF